MTRKLYALIISCNSPRRRIWGQNKLKQKLFFILRGRMDDILGEAVARKIRDPTAIKMPS